MPRRPRDYQGVRSEGGLLPPDILQRLTDPQRPLEGLEPHSYGLHQSERLNDAITQSWNRLQKHWRDFQTARDAVPEGEAATGLTNERWTLPLLRELGFGTLPATAGPTVNGRSYPIARFVGFTPIHLIGCGLSLDRRAAGQRGAAQHNPHALVQEFLNRSSDHLWGIVSNGLQLRVLRDNQALSRLSYLEFDLETIFGSEAYGDFVILWLTIHATRFTANDPRDSSTCWLERWSQEAQAQGTRALDSLRTGVEQALLEIGRGFVDHPRNTLLRERLRSSALTPRELHAQLLRVIYRLIFLFVTEDRLLDGHPILHPPDDTLTGRTARERYATHYGTARLREMAGRITGARHHDLWNAHQIVIRALHGGSNETTTRELLALPSLGSFLWDPATTSDLNDAYLTNHDFLETIRKLAFTRAGNVLRPVDYRNLGSEELGSVYEGLLALTPEIGGDGHSFTFTELSGNERKTSGSYYTPTSLVNQLLDTTIDPVVEDVTHGKDPITAEAAILNLKICDPSVGSGHFLIGAAHRLARHLTRTRTNRHGDGEASPPEYQRALRDVIGHCLYGIDLNPMATELCKVALWLEALEPGKPLSFLDTHIKTGNSLIGVHPTANTETLLTNGIPDEAFTPGLGDDKTHARGARDRNRRQTPKANPQGISQQSGFAFTPAAAGTVTLAAAVAALDAAPDDTIDAVRAKAALFERIQTQTAFRADRDVANAIFAAYAWPKYPGAPDPITHADLITLSNGGPLTPDRRAAFDAIIARHRPFHFHLEFPDVFDRDDPGFHVILGNPPWERIKVQEKEWFASRHPDIANAATAAKRTKLIEELRGTQPALHAAFEADLRASEAESRYLRTSGRYPLCGRGDVNTYTIFAELNRVILHPRGRAGFIVPSGIATDDTTKAYFQEIVEKKNLVSLFDFENRNRIFAGIDSRIKFALVTLTGSERPIAEATFVFFAHDVTDIEQPDRRFTLTADDIALLNPNTRTCPTFRSQRDAEITKGIYRRVPVLINEETGENPWGVSFMRMFDMTNDSGLFRTETELGEAGYAADKDVFRKGSITYVPLYEGKMLHHFDHRFATFDGDGIRDTTEAEHTDVAFEPRPRFWAPAAEATGRLTKLGASGVIEWTWKQPWLLGFRNIGRSTDVRTGIFSLFPRTAVGNNAPLMLPDAQTAEAGLILAAMFKSFVVDYAARQSLGGTTMNFFIVKQLPALPRGRISELNARFITRRAIELVATSTKMAAALGLDRPFRWDLERRLQLRAELDALFFSLFGVSRDDVDYILDSFPIARAHDEDRHGHYRTKAAILHVYDELARCRAEGHAYVSPLDPPPGQVR
jgi:hypothetical protein